MTIKVRNKGTAALSALSLVGATVLTFSALQGGAVAFGPQQQTLPGALFLGNNSNATTPTTVNTFTSTFTLTQSPADPSTSASVTVTLSGAQGPLTGPVPVGANGQIVRSTVNISGAMTEDVDLASGDACNYPTSTIAAGGNDQGPWTTTGTYTATGTGAATIALKQIRFDDGGNFDGGTDGAQNRLCQGTNFNADYFVSGEGSTNAKTDLKVSTSVKQAFTISDTPPTTEPPTTEPPTTEPPTTEPPTTEPPTTTAPPTTEPPTTTAPPTTEPPTTEPPTTEPPTTPGEGQIPSTVTEVITDIKCQNQILGVSNWTDAGQFGAPASPADNPELTVELTPSKPAPGEAVSIRVIASEGIANGPTTVNGSVRPVGVVTLSGGLTDTIVIPGDPFQGVGPTQRFPNFELVAEDAFNLPGDGSTVEVTLSTLTFDSNSGGAFRWPEANDTFTTVCNKSDSPLTDTVVNASSVGRAAFAPIGLTAAVPFDGEVTPAPTLTPVPTATEDPIPTLDEETPIADESGGSLPQTGPLGTISSLVLAALLFQIGLILAVRAVRAQPRAVARH